MCPHCKQYLSEWNNIKKNLNINCIEFEDSTHKNEIIEADIEYYPTVKLFDNFGNSYIIDDISLEGIKQFIKFKK